MWSLTVSDYLNFNFNQFKLNLIKTINFSLKNENFKSQLLLLASDGWYDHIQIKVECLHY